MQLYDKTSLLDYSTEYNLKSFENSVLLGLLEDYVNGAIIQWNRLQSTRMDGFNLLNDLNRNSEIRSQEIKQYMEGIKNTVEAEDFPRCSKKINILHENMNKIEDELNKVSKKIWTQRSINQRMLFLDIHFYLICCSKVQNIIKKLSEKEEDNLELFALWTSLNPQFTPLIQARNFLEHIDEKTEPKYLRDMGNLWGDKYTFGGKEVDIGPESLKFICESYEKVFDTIIK